MKQYPAVHAIAMNILEPDYTPVEIVVPDAAEVAAMKRTRRPNGKPGAWFSYLSNERYQQAFNYDMRP